MYFISILTANSTINQPTIVSNTNCSPHVSNSPAIKQTNSCPIVESYSCSNRIADQDTKSYSGRNERANYTSCTITVANYTYAA
jgi:hypothetical protein